MYDFDCNPRCWRDPCLDREPELGIVPQRHVHEYIGSVMIAEAGEDPHNHRFSGVSGQAILLGDGSHVHRLATRTDFYEDHFHIIRGISGPGIDVGGGRHIHYVEAATTIVDGHRHNFRANSMINDPIGE